MRGPGRHRLLVWQRTVRLNRAMTSEACMRQIVLLLLLFAASLVRGATTDWSAYGGDGRGQRYTASAQITPKNVDRLELAWSFRTGELGQGFIRASDALTFEVTPLLIGDTLYFDTATGKAFAVDAVTGAERWRFDAKVDPGRYYSEMTSRGVGYWRDAHAAGRACAERI